MDVSRNLMIMTLVVLIAIGIVVLLSHNGALTPKTPKDMDAFSKCLSSKGAKMFGTYWSTPCQNQKDMFGDSWKNMKYVECDTGSGMQTAECSQEEIGGYPTWDFSGTKVAGELTFQQLSDYTGCQLD